MYRKIVYIEKLKYLIIWNEWSIVYTYTLHNKTLFKLERDMATTMRFKS